MGKEDFKVTPWEVSGEVDYGRLIKEFGLQELKHLPKVFEKEVLFRRGIVFAHRDFHRIAEAIEKKKKFAMMTGLMPSGKFHIGHMILDQQMIFYQKVTWILFKNLLISLLNGILIQKLNNCKIMNKLI